MKLKIGVGIDNLVFGMKRAAIQRIIGKPDKIFIDEDDSNQLIWVFNKKKMMLTFYRDENYKLGYLRTSHPQLTYNGIKLIGMDIKSVKHVFGNRWKVDDYCFFSTYTNYGIWIVFEVAYGVVTGIEVGVLPDKLAGYVWPVLSRKKHLPPTGQRTNP